MLEMQSSKPSSTAASVSACRLQQWHIFIMFVFVGCVIIVYLWNWGLSVSQKAAQVGALKQALSSLHQYRTRFGRFPTSDVNEWRKILGKNAEQDVVIRRMAGLFDDTGNWLVATRERGNADVAMVLFLTPRLAKRGIFNVIVSDDRVYAVDENGHKDSVYLQGCVFGRSSGAISEVPEYHEDKELIRLFVGDVP